MLILRVENNKIAEHDEFPLGDPRADNSSLGPKVLAGWYIAFEDTWEEFQRNGNLLADGSLSEFGEDALRVAHLCNALSYLSAKVKMAERTDTDTALLIVGEVKEGLAELKMDSAEDITAILCSAMVTIEGMRRSTPSSGFSVVNGEDLLKYLDDMFGGGAEDNKG